MIPCKYWLRSQLQRVCNKFRRKVHGAAAGKVAQTSERSVHNTNCQLPPALSSVRWHAGGADGAGDPPGAVVHAAAAEMPWNGRMCVEPGPQAASVGQGREERQRENFAPFRVSTVAGSRPALLASGLLGSPDWSSQDASGAPARSICATI